MELAKGEMFSRRQVTKTEAGKCYQRDLLTKEVNRLRKTLSNQIGGFDGLHRSVAEIPIVEQELERINRTLTDLTNTSKRLSSFVTVGEAEKLDSDATRDRENVERMEIAIKDWIDARRKVEPEAPKPRSAGRSVESGKEIDKTGEFAFKHSILMKQLGLVDEMLAAEDVHLARTEVKKLKRLYWEVCELSVD